ncbi:hypothetical protein HN51_048611 [Arachis hypogaea]
MAMAQCASTSTITPMVGCNIVAYDGFISHGKRRVKNGRHASTWARPPVNDWRLVAGANPESHGVSSEPTQPYEFSRGLWRFRARLLRLVQRQTVRCVFEAPPMSTCNKPSGFMATIGPYSQCCGLVVCRR